MSQKMLHSLAKHIVKTTEPIIRQVGNREVLMYALSDISVTFDRTSKTFIGMYITVLGLNVVYANNELSVIDGDEISTIHNIKLQQRIYEFAAWRLNVLSEFNF